MVDFKEFLILKIGAQYKLHKAKVSFNSYSDAPEFSTLCALSFEDVPTNYMQKVWGIRARNKECDSCRIEYAIVPKSMLERDQYTAVCPICFPNGVENE